MADVTKNSVTSCRLHYINCKNIILLLYYFITLLSTTLRFVSNMVILSLSCLVFGRGKVNGFSQKTDVVPI